MDEGFQNKILDDNLKEFIKNEPYHLKYYILKNNKTDIEKKRKEKQNAKPEKKKQQENGSKKKTEGKSDL